jgi:sugar phosphate isomerase/epimerase
MKLGISSYTYTWAVGVPGSMPAKPLTAYDLVDKAASRRLEVIQVADNFPLEYWNENQLLDLLRYGAGRNVTFEMAGRGMEPSHTLKCLNTAVAIKSPILRMVIDSAGFEPDINSIISIIRDLIPEFESHKIKLAIENHDRFKAREFAKIIESANSEWIGICLDSVNSMGAGEGFETVSEILLPYTINLHIKDFTIQRVSHKMGIIIEGTPAGKGILNIKELVTRVIASDRCQSMILELWTPPLAEIEATIAKEEKWAEESIQYLKSLIL